MPNKSVAVCIVNYNSYKDTIECIESLLLPTEAEVSIVVVDNCSTNESVTMIEEYLKQQQIDFYLYHHSQNKVSPQSKHKIYLIQSSVNGGFSYGNNIAIRWVKNYLDTDYILFLNNDTVVPVGFMDILLREYAIKQAITKSKIALGATEINYFTKQYSHSGLQYLNLPTGLVFGKPLPPYFKYICGACLLVDIDAPPMDEEYFLYFDDVEYSKMLKNNSYELYATDKTHYFHKISATTSKMKSTLNFQFASLWRFFGKHYPLYMRIVFITRRLQYFIKNQKEKNRVLLDTFKNR